MRRLLWIVALVHGVVLGTWALFSMRAPSKSSPQKVVIRERVPVTPKKAPVAAVQSPAQSSPSPKSAPSPSASSPSSTPKTKKKPAAKKEVQPQAKKAQKKPQGGGTQDVAQLLRGMQKSLSQLEEAHLLVESGPSDYEELLTCFLKEALILPERGDVRVRLTLSPLGKVEKVEMLSWASEQNRDYVQKRLAELTFPPLGKKMKKSQSFPLVLTGEG